jgi:hypothetical protein
VQRASSGRRQIEALDSPIRLAVLLPVFRSRCEFTDSVSVWGQGFALPLMKIHRQESNSQKHPKSNLLYADAGFPPKTGFWRFNPINSTISFKLTPTIRCGPLCRSSSVHLTESGWGTKPRSNAATVT